MNTSCRLGRRSGLGRDLLAVHPQSGPRARGRDPVWDDPSKAKDLMALAAGVVVRDDYPEQFGAVHHALFVARHDRGLDLRDRR